MPSVDPKRVQALVEEAVANGASTVEEIHQAVAAAPLEIIKQVEVLRGPAETAQDLTARSIGTIYDTIRRVNEEVGVMAEQVLGARDDLG